MNDIQERIIELKKEKNALILAHFYQTYDIQEVSDVVGDSFELARRARDAGNPLIVLCGVRFMAESAKILNPDKTVLLPRPDAGCPMADMIEPAQVRALRREHPKAAVMCYVNSTAAVKAESDICCTSSSAVRLARSIRNDEIIFIPDKNLGAFVAAQVPEKRFYFHDGYCVVHDAVSPEEAVAAKNAHPGAELLMHPECAPETLAHADFAGSTAEILKYVESSAKTAFIIGTEVGIIERLRVTAPTKRCWPLSPKMLCRNMKKTKISDLCYSLEQGRHEVRLPAEELDGARRALTAML